MSDVPPEAPELAAGELRLWHSKEKWWLVEVGRKRYVKRFNLNENEAQELTRLLVTYVPGCQEAAEEGVREHDRI